jgi:hypothetical protein
LDHLNTNGATTPELTTGVRLLGFPIGNKAFARNILTEASKTYSSIIDTLFPVSRTIKPKAPFSELVLNQQSPIC